MKTVIIQKQKNRQIRIGTLETNSSSTHSVTISRKGGKTNASLPLVENGVLYPSRLADYTHCFGDSRFTTCSTKDEKAAMVCNWVNEQITEQLQYEFTNMDSKEAEQAAEAWLTTWINYLKDALGYEKIHLQFANFYPNSEYGESYLSLCAAYDEDDVEATNAAVRKQLDKLIAVILDDKMEIIDSDTAY